MRNEEVIKSAKVYVLDFHFKSNSKEIINLQKLQFDIFFDRLRIKLEKYNCVEQVFLRKH